MEWIGAFVLSMFIPCSESNIDYCGPINTVVNDPNQIHWESEAECKDFVARSIEIFEGMAEAKGWDVRYTIPACREVDSAPSVFNEKLDITG